MPKIITRDKIEAIKEAIKSATSMVDVARESGLSLSTCYKIAQAEEIPTPFRHARSLRLSVVEREKLLDDILYHSIYAAARALGVKPVNVQSYIHKHYARKIVAMGLPVPEGHRDYRIALYILRNPEALDADAEAIAAELRYHPSIVRRYFER